MTFSLSKKLRIHEHDDSYILGDNLYKTNKLHIWQILNDSGDVNLKKQKQKKNSH